MAALARRQAHATGRREDAERIVVAIGRLVAGVVSEQHVEYQPAGAVLVTLAHLVAWPDVEAYHSAIGRAREAWPDVQLAMTGPWPPYSFVE
jgi:hypothetical protein